MTKKLATIFRTDGTNVNQEEGNPMRRALCFWMVALVLAMAGATASAQLSVPSFAVGDSAVSIFNSAPDPYCQSGLANLFANGWDATIPFTMVSSRNDNRFVSYTSGTLYIELMRILSTHSAQLFSDRYAPPSCDWCFPEQPFYSQAADSLDVEIFPNGFVTIYNNTWGGAASFMGRCLGTNQPLLYGYLGDTLFVLSFGQPRPRF